MGPFTKMFFADVTLTAGGFSWVWAAFWVLMAALVALVALGYRAGWFLPKYRLAQADLAQDKLTLKIFGSSEISARSRRQAQVVPRYQLPGYRSDGFKVVRVAFGREVLIGSQCVYVLQREDGTPEEQVLVARGDRSSAPMAFHEQLNELGRSLARMVQAFEVNGRKVQASRDHYRARLQGLKHRHEALYGEYRQRRAVGEGCHTLSTQLTDCEVRIKDLNKRLDEMK